MIEWEKVPWPLWVYAALTLGEIFVLAFTVSTPVAPLIFSTVLILAWTFFLLRAIRWLWIATVVVDILGMGINLATDNGSWRGYLIGLIVLGLLLLPATRRFFAKGEAVGAT